MAGAETPHTPLNFFFDGPPHASLFGLGGQNDGQNDGLRVRNVKMKKIVPGQIRGTCTCMYGLRHPSINQFEIFFSKIVKLDEEEC